jgi:hypothetical protein
MSAVCGAFPGTKNGILSTRYLPMDQAGWSCVVADLDGFHFLPLTFLRNNASKSSKFVVESISNEVPVRG